MRTPASVAGHPIHPMIVPLAIGGFALSFVFDLVRLFSGDAQPWSGVAFYTMVGALVAAVIAALFGFADFWSLPRGHVRTIGAAHMALNATLIALYAGNVWMRHGAPDALGMPTALSFVGVLVLLASGWLGGMMVYEHGVGVDAGESDDPLTRPRAAQRRDAAA